MRDKSVSNHQSWLRAINIAKILFEDQGYHTKFLEEIEKEIKEKKGLYGAGECRESVADIGPSNKGIRNNGINDWPEDERPRARLIKNGPETLSSAQLLAVVLCTGCEGKSALDLAMEMLARYGDIRGIVEATIHELCSIKGVGFAKAAKIKAVLEIGKRVASYPLSKRRRILSSKDVYDIYRHFAPYYQGLKKEVFKLLMLAGK